LSPPRSSLAFPGPAGLQSHRPLYGFDKSSRPARPLLPLGATPTVSPTKCRLPTRVSGRPGSTFERHLAEAPAPFSMSGPWCPSSHMTFGHASDEPTRSTRSPVLRVWLPSRRRQPPKPSEASFSSQRSWASPFRAFLLPGDRQDVSTLSSAPALFQQTSRPVAGAPAASAPRKSRPPQCPRRFSSSRRLCSPGLSASQAFLSQSL
jgi:hypothetical protein